METKKNILTEAIIEFEQLMEVAKSKAKDQMANELPEKFNRILNEHLTKLDTIKKENINETKESKKDVINESVKTDKKEKESKKDKIDESLVESDDIDLVDFSMEELEEVFNNANDEDEFEIVENDEFESDESNDDVDLDTIEAEIEKMDEMVDDVTENVNDPFVKLKKLQEEMNSLISQIEKDRAGDEVITEEEPFNLSDEDEIEIEYDGEFGDDDIDEAHGVSLSNNKLAGSHVQPRPEYADYKKDKLRFALQRENYKKRIDSLISENKKQKLKNKELSKKLDETNILWENYRDVIGKYRNQLNEMVVFNTNLSYVNNLLINEDLNLSKDDKIEIVEKFKPVSNIDESEKIYNTILEEKTKSKETLNESDEKKFANIVESSSNQIIGEALEKSAFKNNDHIDKIKKHIKYVESKK